MGVKLKVLQKIMALIEVVWLIALFFAMWYPIQIRNQWLWLLLAYIPFVLLKKLRFGRIIASTPLNLLLLIFLILAAVNIYAAPYTLGFPILARLLAGIILFTYAVDYGATHRHIHGLLAAAVILAGVLAAITLGASQWTMKSIVLMPLINTLPTLRGFPGFEQGGNVNELAGAVAYLLPPMAALAIYRWRDGAQRGAVTVIFLALALGLFLGQSRMAILGVLLTLFIFAFLLIPRGIWRYTALLALTSVSLFQIVLLTDLLVPPDVDFDQTDRNETSLSSRLEIYRAGFEMLADYPLTGVGISMFRYNPVRQLYPVPSFDERILPHAHNEFIQVAADLGMPGLLVFIGWYAVAAYMLVRLWQQGDDYTRVIATGVGGGLLAHGIYGMGDAITLWDRFIFLFWLLLSLIGGQYAALFAPSPAVEDQHVPDVNSL
jgi:putative inorganic carbon (hco3(-)) transporter